MTIDDAVTSAFETAVEKGFWDSPRNFGELLMLITTELGEALEAHRAGKEINEVNPKSLMGYGKAEVEFKESYETLIKGSVEEEIADAMIRLLDLCGGYNIDISSHVMLKMRYNRLRPKLHGKKY